MANEPYLWGGRFSEVPSAALLAFGASLPVDQRMWAEDIAGSLAHARMLGAIGVLTDGDVQAISSGLQRIAEQIEAGQFVFIDSDEDIHTAIERALVADIGDAGKRLHTGRSRNDQVATDTRLYLKSRTARLINQLKALQELLIQLAETNIDVLMPGYTHLQKAQPLLLAHHLLAYFWMFNRDTRRFEAAHLAANTSPLGAAALAGTSYPLNREQTARELGFVDKDGTPVLIPNSLDAVSDRDFLLDALFAASTTMMHLSRLCEELILWSTEEFGFITLSDGYSTGSSIMPQKKNPDFAELVRGKTGRVYGDLLAVLTVLKGLPLAYNKDMQEDKEAVFDALDTLELCLMAVGGMLSTMTVNSERMLTATQAGFMAATDMADWLVKQGLPFRQAHQVVGQLVLLAEQTEQTLSQLTLDEMQEACSLFDESALAALDIHQVVQARQTFGGTASERVLEQLQLAKAELEQA
ncbi:MAG: argininosuccinate lyase [Coriobacteriales bacterium]|jgi:argininosuccinate lyase|nr:argininosuccinate lyase [Coriobacteriales bacterium]